MMSQLYVLLCFRMEAVPCTVRFCIVVHTYVFEYFLRVHYVQSVIHNPTQLSGRGILYIFYIKLCLSQLYVWGVRFLRIHPVQSNNITQLSGRGFPCTFYMKLCCRICFFVCTPRWTSGRVTFGFLRVMCRSQFPSALFEDPCCTKCGK